LQLDQLGQHQDNDNQPGEARRDRNKDRDPQRGIRGCDRTGPLLRVLGDAGELAADLRQARIRKALADALLQRVQRLHDLVGIERPV
jgi:hypothetical protein